MQSMFTAWMAFAAASAAAETAELTLRIVDGLVSKRPVACRIHLTDEGGKPVRPKDYPSWSDHFVCDGNVKLSLTPGRYNCEIERGPEYQSITTEFQVGDRGLYRGLAIRRMINLPALGWWPGDLHVHRLPEDIELLMRAEELAVAPVITWWNNRNQWADRPIPKQPLLQFDTNRFAELLAGEDEREGGALLFFRLDRPLDVRTADREYPSPMTFVSQARKQPRAWIDVEKPFWWDVPIWLASGKVDSIGLANNHMCRSRMYENEAWGKPRDARQWPSPRGNGYWSQEIYYHVLNTGIRIPPSAGSASGVLPNPVGYNRVYVYTAEPTLDYDRWWDALKKGRSFVTNGPLLRVRANNELPGRVFSSKAGESLDIHLAAEVTSRDPKLTIEIVKDGHVLRSSTWSADDDKVDLGSTKFDASGWFLVRAIADVPHTFRFASTAPFYVEVGELKRRISRKSVQFFLDWAVERSQRVQQNDPQKREQIISHHRDAIAYWRDMLRRANAE